MIAYHTRIFIRVAEAILNDVIYSESQVIWINLDDSGARKFGMGTKCLKLLKWIIHNLYKCAESLLQVTLGNCSVVDIRSPKPYVLNIIINNAS